MSMNEKWFALSIDEIEKKLKTNATRGLAPKVARSRCQNEEAPFFKVKKRNIGELLLDLVSDFFLIMLLLVSTLTLFFEGDYIIGSAMLLLILVNLVLSFGIYYRDRRAQESISDFFLPTARVIRGGKLYIADYRDVVVGDVIIVERGDILGVDARLVQSDGLSVEMRIDKKRRAVLQKLAGAAVREGENRVEAMSNMIHAGSRVLSGSGRAIVVGTGRYTYLGAMTGGFVEVPAREVPASLVGFRKLTSRVGMLLLLLILPFTIFSILFGHFNGGTVLLSSVLSVALTIGATMTLSRCSNLFLSFFVHFMRKNALSSDPCIVRSVKAFDTVADLDYLFLLDGSIATDGILHFEALATVEGETRGFEHISRGAERLCDLIAIYSAAKKSAPAAAINSVGAYDNGIDELLVACSYDTEALRIRVGVHSYLPNFDNNGRDRVIYSEGGEHRELNISFGTAAIEECTYALASSGAKELTAEGRATLMARARKYAAAGKRLATFVVKAGENNCFAGMLVLREGIDASIEKAAERLSQNGVRIISFTNCKGREHAPELPELLRRGRVATAELFAARALPVTYDFGQYDEYCGFGENDIFELVKHVKSCGKKVGMIGFSGYAPDAIDASDVFLTCAPVRTGVFGHFEEEIRSLEIPGGESSASCTQDVKAEADILLCRPRDGKGGLLPLSRIAEQCKTAYGNLKNYVLYLLAVQVMRIVSVILPMLFGVATADARQLLFLGFVLDFFVMLIFMYDTRPSREGTDALREFFGRSSGRSLLKDNSILLICAAVGGGFTVLLPNIFDLFGVFGNYVYKAEFTFISLALMQIALLLCMYSGSIRNTARHKKLVQTPAFIVMSALTVIFAALCLLTPVGTFFGIVRAPAFYLLLSVVPAAAFLLCFVIMFELTPKSERLHIERRKNKKQ